MRLIIAGSRPPKYTEYKDEEYREQLQLEWLERAGAAIDSLLDANEVDVVLSGEALGVDKLGEYWAMTYGVDIERYPAKWDLYGRAAGYRRNAEMAENADTVLAIWDGKSKGTRHMITLALDKGLDVVVKVVLP